MSKTQGERLATLEQWVIDHEARCEERLGEIKTNLNRLMLGFVGLILSLLAWAGAQLYTTNQVRLDRLENPPSAGSHAAVP